MQLFLPAAPPFLAQKWRLPRSCGGGRKRFLPITVALCDTARRASARLLRHCAQKCHNETALVGKNDSVLNDRRRKRALHAVCGGIPRLTAGRRRHAYVQWRRFFTVPAPCARRSRAGCSGTAPPRLKRPCRGCRTVRTRPRAHRCRSRRF